MDQPHCCGKRSGFSTKFKFVMFLWRLQFFNKNFLVCKLGSNCLLCTYAFLLGKDAVAVATFLKNVCSDSIFGNKV